jgi:TolA-binding protein
MHPDLKRLRELPDAEAPPYGYAEFSRRHSRRRARQAQAPLRLMAVALAVVVAGWVMKHGLAPEPPRSAAAPSQGALPLAMNAERWLNAQPRSAIVRVPTQMAVTQLEDQIAAMDDQINAMRLAQPHAQQAAVLQRDRAQLVQSLAQVRYAQILVAGVE